MAQVTLGGRGALSEHDAAWDVAERATTQLNRFAGTATWLGPRIEHRPPDHWLAWVEREPRRPDRPNEVHVFAPTEAQALRQLAWQLAEQPPE